MSERERAARWLRVSSGGQDEANQEPDVDRHCEARGYDVVKTYTLHDRSAYHGEQQAALDEVVAGMRAGLFTVLVIWHSDRLERREGKALLDVLAEIREAGGRAESVKEPMLGQLDFGGQVTTFIAGLVNHEKSRHIAEQVGLAKDRIAANGGLDGRAPWGFSSEGPKYGRRLVPTAQAREYVPLIYARVIAGESLAAVCRWLNAEGVAPVGIARERKDGRGKAGLWWPGSLAKLIRNPVYMGLRVDGSGQTVSTCEPILLTPDGRPDAGTWALAGRALENRPKRGPVLRENRCALSGASRCLACGGPMYRIRCGNGNPHYYLRCSGTGPARKSCGAAMVRLDTAGMLADWVIGGLAHPVYEIREIPGNDAEISAQLAALDYQRRQVALRGLSWADEDAERARIREQYEIVAATERIPSRREAVDTGITYGQRWAKLDVHGRAAWLRSGEFTVLFLRGEDERATAYLDGVSMVLHWYEDEDAP